MLLLLLLLSRLSSIVKENFQLSDQAFATPLGLLLLFSTFQWSSDWSCYRPQWHVSWLLEFFNNKNLHSFFSSLNPLEEYDFGILSNISKKKNNNNFRPLPKEKDTPRTELDMSVSLHFTIAVHHVYEGIINSHNRKRAVRIK